MSKNTNYLINYSLLSYIGIVIIIASLLSFSGCLNKNDKIILNNTNEGNITKEKEVKISDYVGMESLKPTGGLHIDVEEIYIYSIEDNPITNARTLLPGPSNDVWCEPIRLL